MSVDEAVRIALFETKECGHDALSFYNGFLVTVDS
jgi:hypothetical protein